MNRTPQLIVGILFWIAVGVAIVVGVIRLEQPSPTQSAHSQHTSLLRFLTSAPTEITRVDPSGTLQRYDPVFLQNADGHFRQVGYVRERMVANPQNSSTATTVTIAWHDREFVASEVDFVQYRNTGRLEDVAKLMLPAEKRQRIRQQLEAAMQMYGDEFSKAFQPLVQQTVTQSLPVIEAELQLSIGRHRDEIDALTKRWNEEVVRKRLVPLARNEIMPIVKQHGQPTVEKMGREIWKRASLWRFGWRAVYDRTPLPEQNLVNEEWQRFVKNEAVPVFEENMDEIVSAVQQILTATAANPTVRAELAEVAADLAQDPAAQKLVKTILQETLVGNERLHHVWANVWQSDEARQAIEMASRRMEPVIRNIGDELFGTQEEGIDPRFALVLRNQIFGKDRRWIIAMPNGKEPTPIDEAHERGSEPPSDHRVIRFATQWMAYPIVHLAGEESL